MTQPGDPTKLAPSQRRLQRRPDFTGGQLSRFSEVAWRHGLPGVALAVLCLLVPDMRALLGDATEAFREQPAVYLRSAFVMSLALVAYPWWLDRRVDLASAGWIFYLLAVSIWEEWVFRLALPYFAAERGIALPLAVAVSSLVFGFMHYFTLRWKWHWCVLASLGGVGLSRQFGEHGDLVLLIGVHWVATVINTPRLPGSRRRTATGGSRPGGPGI